MMHWHRAIYRTVLDIFAAAGSTLLWGTGCGVIEAAGRRPVGFALGWLRRLVAGRRSAKDICNVLLLDRGEILCMVVGSSVPLGGQWRGVLAIRVTRKGICSPGSRGRQSQSFVAMLAVSQSSVSS